MPASPEPSGKKPAAIYISKKVWGRGQYQGQGGVDAFEISMHSKNTITPAVVVAERPSSPTFFECFQTDAAVVDARRTREETAL